MNAVEYHKIFQILKLFRTIILEGALDGGLIDF